MPLKSYTAACLFPSGNAVVIGLPQRFDLGTQLERATQIRLATAFAHLSGWRLLAHHVCGSKARIELVAGLHYCQTEPKVLRIWVGLASGNTRINAYVVGRLGPMFHPKVLIVKRGRAGFAIVGSGNLSAGGLRDNVECSVFTADRDMVAHLSKWFDELVANACTHRVRTSDIKSYELLYDKAKRARAGIHALQRRAELEINAAHQASMHRWEEAVAYARSFLDTDRFHEIWTNNWRPAVGAIKDALGYPDFNFDANGWRKFYSILPFGHLIAIRRDLAFSQSSRLKSGLRNLLDETRPVDHRLNAMLLKRGRFHVDGVGLNLLSKVLAVHNPRRWPVFNEPVRQTLKHFDYEAPRGGSKGGKYSAFAELMQRFKREAGARNMLMLDPVFYNFYEQKLKHRPA
jgi:HKD family nuclease